MRKVLSPGCLPKTTGGQEKETRSHRLRQNRREATDWDKIFAKDTSDKDCYLKYTQNSWNSTIKVNNLILKWEKYINRPLIKEDIQMENKQMKRCSTSYLIGELQIKTTSHHYTVFRTTKVQHTKTPTKSQTPATGEDVEREECPSFADGSAESQRCFGGPFGSLVENWTHSHHWQFLIKLNTLSPFDLQPCSWYLPKGVVHLHPHTHLHTRP